MLALVFALCAVDPSLLGSPDWQTRELVEWGLQVRGKLAWKSLLRFVDDEDPEVRLRVHRLLAPYRDSQLELQAWRILRSPFPMTDADEAAFFGDRVLRVRVYRLAIASGCFEWQAQHLHPKNDYWDWWCACSARDRCLGDLETCRRWLGAFYVWPFR